jgi:hypothetical protein
MKLWLNNHILTSILSTVVFVILFSFESCPQRNVKDSIIGTPWISIEYGLNWTGRDLAEKHGLINHIGLFTGYKTKRNWTFGLEGNFMFGNDIRVNGLFDHLLDSNGNITDINGDIAKVRALSRGFHVNILAGKIFPVFSHNQNSGLYINTGIGFLAHKIRVETQDQVIPSLELDYRKGYDRLSTGLNTHQFIGYSFMANQGALNFYAGFYFQQGYTYNQRDVFFDNPETKVSKEMMIDLQSGFKVAWLIPIYKRVPKEYYFN